MKPIKIKNIGRLSKPYSSQPTYRFQYLTWVLTLSTFDLSWWWILIWIRNVDLVISILWFLRLHQQKPITTEIWQHRSFASLLVLTQKGEETRNCFLESHYGLSKNYFFVLWILPVFLYILLYSLKWPSDVLLVLWIIQWNLKYIFGESSRATNLSSFSRYEEEQSHSCTF